MKNVNKTLRLISLSFLEYIKENENKMQNDPSSVAVANVPYYIIFPENAS